VYVCAYTECIVCSNTISNENIVKPYKPDHFCKLFPEWIGGVRVYPNSY